MMWQKVCLNFRSSPAQTLKPKKVRENLSVAKSRSVPALRLERGSSLRIHWGAALQLSFLSLSTGQPWQVRRIRPHREI